MMNKEEAAEFASRWLPAWTGNEPEKLASFYSDDCFYSDSGIPSGAKGKAELIAYFRKLLVQNPDWVWSQIEAIPMEGGFLNKWLAKIPVGKKHLSALVFVSCSLTDKERSGETKFTLIEQSWYQRFIS